MSSIIAARTDTTPSVAPTEPIQNNGAKGFRESQIDGAASEMLEFARLNLFVLDEVLEDLSLQMSRLSLNTTQIHCLSSSSDRSAAENGRNSPVLNLTRDTDEPSQHLMGDASSDFGSDLNFSNLGISFPGDEHEDGISLVSDQDMAFLTDEDRLFFVVARCSICFSLGNIAELDCKHNICKACLGTLLQTALSDRSLLPVRCCQQPLSIDLAAAVLPPADLHTLIQRTRQAQAKEFMYCPRPTCSAFIDLDPLPPEALGAPLECDACAAAFCAACKSAWHPAAPCAANRAALAAEAAALDALARAAGWMRCGRCAVYVSRAQGCNHMTCACGHHFCYACGAAWKTCACALWSEEEQRRAEQARTLAAMAEEREALRRRLTSAEAAAVRERVRGVFAWEAANGECQHDDRAEVDGDFGGCARCDWRCNRYGFACGRCRLVFCRTCHYHRM
jgi:hypothetical protein